MRSRSTALLLILTVTLAACAGAAAKGDSIAVDEATVRMFDNRYEFLEIEIPVGGTVTFEGSGRNPHNAVAADGSWSTEDVFGSLEQVEGDSAMLTFDQAGIYTFYCTFHGNADGDGMAGTIIVADGD